MHARSAKASWDTPSAATAAAPGAGNGGSRATDRTQLQQLKSSRTHTGAHSSGPTHPPTHLLLDHLGLGRQHLPHSGRHAKLACAPPRRARFDGPGRMCTGGAAGGGGGRSQHMVLHGKCGRAGGARVRAGGGAASCPLPAAAAAQAASDRGVPSAAAARLASALSLHIHGQVRLHRHGCRCSGSLGRSAA